MGTWKRILMGPTTLACEDLPVDAFLDDAYRALLGQDPAGVSIAERNEAILRSRGARHHVSGGRSARRRRAWRIRRSPDLAVPGEALARRRRADDHGWPRPGGPGLPGALRLPPGVHRGPRAKHRGARPSREREPWASDPGWRPSRPAFRAQGADVGDRVGAGQGAGPHPSWWRGRGERDAVHDDQLAAHPTAGCLPRGAPCIRGQAETAKSPIAILEYRDHAAARSSDGLKSLS